jgi:Flp pilus assembly pilin Flp
MEAALRARNVTGTLAVPVADGRQPGGIMSKVVVRLRALPYDDRAQDLTEYGLLAGLIAIVAIAAIGGVGTAANAMWEGIVTRLKEVL